MRSFEVFYKDLTNEAKKRLLETFDMKDEKEANWDVFPMTIIDIEED